MSDQGTMPVDDAGNPPDDQPQEQMQQGIGINQASPEEQDQYNRFVTRASQIMYDDKTRPMILELLRGGEGGPDTAQGSTPETGAAPDSGEDGALATDQPPAPGGAPVTPPTAGGAADEAEPQDNPQEEGAEAPTGANAAPTGASVGPVHGIAKAAEMVFTRVAGAVEQAGDKLNPDVALHAGIEIFNLLAEMSEKAGIKDYSQDQDSAEAAFFEAIDSVVQKAKQSGEVDEQKAAADMERLIKADHDGLLKELMGKLAAQDGGGQPQQQEPATPMKRRGMGV